jgi:large repetitive protein
MASGENRATPAGFGRARDSALLTADRAEPRARRGRLAFAGLAVALALVAVPGLKAAGVAGAGASLLDVAFSSTDCQETSVTALVAADSWLDENSPLANKGSDSILNVQAGSPVEPEAVPPLGRARALVRFALPSGVPSGCVVESAKLRLFSPDGNESFRAEAVRIDSGWSESQVTWSDQPGTIGAAAAAWSTDGYVQWNVAGQVQAMLDGADHGFLIRDAAEGAEGGGDHGFHSKEKGESPPELVIRFAAPPSGEPPGPPAPPAPAVVRCGQALTASTRVTNDLVECPGDGLVIGAPRIIVDLDGHTIDGVGLGAGILNDGYASVTVRNGTVQEFDYGIRLRPETTLNVVEVLTLRRNQLAGIELFDAGARGGNEVRANTVENNGDGIALVSGTRGTVTVDNTMSVNSGAGLRLRDAHANRLERNSVSGGGDLGIGLERSSGNTLLGNTVSGNSDGGIEIRHASNGNRVESNEVSESGDTGIMVDESDRNELISNTTRLLSDSGITLNSANDGVVRDNDVRFSPGGLQMDGSSRNLVEANNASRSSGIGIELGGGSYDNLIERNTANDNGASGIYIADEALTEPGNRITRNTASGNRADGIVVAKGGHTITANDARNNGGWGINATGENIDGLGNVATGNGQVQQCIGVVCNEESPPPDTDILDRPNDPTNATSASFAFAGSDDSSPPAELRFECRLDSHAEEAFGACTSPHRHTSLSAGSHTFEVRAVDGAGNVDPTPAGYTWTVDTIPPETTIQSRPDDPTRSTAATFQFSTDEPGSTFQCSLDAAPFAACTSPAGYDGLEGGAHRFEVRATDQAGNLEPDPARYEWAVDVTPPETTIESGPDDPTGSTAATFSFSADESGSTFECALDRAPFEPCATPVEYSGLAHGEHRFEVRAIDRVGNVEPEPAIYEWTVDVTPPETTIDSSPDDPTTSGSASFSFSASEPNSTFECSLDGAPFAACTSPREYTGLTAGTHQFRVQAIDAAANVDPTPAGYAWTIDQTAPQTTIESSPDPQTTSTTATFTFSADEPDTSFQCSLDGAQYAACSSPVQLTGLALATHRFLVRAIDAAGNTDATPASRAWTISAACPTVTVPAVADSSIEQSSPSLNLGARPLLKVRSYYARRNARSLVRFPLPAVPESCELVTATLRLFAASAASGRTLQARRVTGNWTENGVTWASQPATTGPSATAPSGIGWRQWKVLSQVQAMYAGTNWGLLIRDASEGDGGRREQSFHSREAATTGLPQLILTFG